ncbi:LysR substrate-binding domain-containing protein [Novosphingobium sp. 1949]|uniref:LysR substrate-binding domain-containing protein n=1 Tax=Novosphingobium organovorum TaxID=2930092 RepID=A0ABT0BEH7_9SPHN|nr:LysR substrate-binding domain-containing protein [Novosphingobium organovorum]MCJ2183455.1 LysR substrate-binding domain-containing protein [Novosphingobium organovorum]
MELRHLRYFLCVAEENHFGRAAQRLGISQPPLSQQIRALEAELGVALFERTSRRVRLTEAGRQFLPQAQATLRQADLAVQAVRLANQGEVGRLALGFSTSVPFIPLVMDALWSFRRRYPKVDLQLNELPRDEQVARLARGTLDVGILRTLEKPQLPDGFVSHCLQREGVVLAMPRDHPMALREQDPVLGDLEGEALIMYGAIYGAGFNEYVLAECERMGFQPNVAMEAGSLATLLGLTAAGFGVAILSQSLVRLNLDTLAFRRLDVPFTSQLLMIHTREPAPTTRAFRELVGLPALTCGQ